MANYKDDEDAPASVLVKTAKGGQYDINNISGAAKKKLIRAGEIEEDAFNTPDNMPGKKLAELRARKREETKDNGHPDIPNPYHEGQLVQYREYVSEVVEVDEKKGVKIRKREGGISKWIHHSKVSPNLSNVKEE